MADDSFAMIAVASSSGSGSSRLLVAKSTILF